MGGEKGAEKAQPRRSKRIYVYWGVALTLLISAALFCWLVVVPVQRVHASTFRCQQRLSGGLALTREQLADEVECMGGPSKAARSIVLYLRVPQRWTPYRDTSAWMLMGCGESGGSAARQLLKDHDWRVREAAVFVLGRHGSSKSIDTIVAMLEDEHAVVRYAVACALGRRKDPRALDGLVRALRDRNGGVREEAARALGKLGDARAVDALRKALTDEKNSVRQAAAEALKEIRAVRNPDK